MQSQIDFIKKIFPTHKIKDDEVIVRCPKCGDPRKPSKIKMNINIQKGIFHCWVCDLKGSSIPRLLRMVNPSAAQQYAKQFGVKTHRQEKNSVKDIAKLPEDFQLVMTSLHLPEGKRIQRYCHARGLSDDLIWRYRIGFSDTQKYRMIVPSFDESGHLNYWTARRIDEDPKWKYINAEVSRTSVIFNELDLDWSSEEIILVEGPFDLMKCDGLNATCLLGSTLNIHYDLFTKLIHYPEKIILALDHDAQEKQDKIAELLMSYDKEVYFVNPPTRDDYGVLENCDWGDLDPKIVKEKMSHRIKYTPTTRLIRKIHKL